MKHFLCRKGLQITVSALLLLSLLAWALLPEASAAPSISLSPTSGRGNITVAIISGSGFVIGPANCAITSNPGGLIFSYTCSIDGSGIPHGSFSTVLSPSPGVYLVTVTSTLGDSAFATFTVPPPPTLILTPSYTSAGLAQVVSASGLNYVGSICQITSPIVQTYTCTISSGVLFSTSFTVNPSTTVGTYTVMVSTDAGSGDSATYPFVILPSTTMTTTATTTATSTTSTTITATSTTTTTVSFNPVIGLTPSPARQSQLILFSGSGFAPTDLTCSVSSTIATSPACTIFSGSVSGSFTTSASAASGSYVITVVGQSGDSASAPLMIAPPSTLTLIPSAGPVGQVVTVSGNNYLGSTCLLSSTGLFFSQSCSISGDSLSGSFTVQPSASLGQYTVTAQSNVESAQQIFTVLPATTAVFYTTTATTPFYTSTATTPLYTTTATGTYYTTTATTPYYSTTVPGPILNVSPVSGLPSQLVTFVGSGFSLSDTSCTVSGLVVSIGSCSVSSGQVVGSFTVYSHASAGSYYVFVHGSPVGDSASGIFTVATSATSTTYIATVTGTSTTVSTYYSGVVTVPQTQYVGVMTTTTTGTIQKVHTTTITNTIPATTTRGTFTETSTAYLVTQTLTTHSTLTETSVIPSTSTTIQTISISATTETTTSENTFMGYSVYYWILGTVLAGSVGVAMLAILVRLGKIRVPSWRGRGPPTGEPEFPPPSVGSLGATALPPEVTGEEGVMPPPVSETEQVPSETGQPVTVCNSCGVPRVSPESVYCESCGAPFAPPSGTPEPITTSESESRIAIAEG